MNDTTTSPERGETDWAAWSRGAVETMMARNTEWPRQFGLQVAPQYRWDLETASLVLQAPLHEVQGTVCLVGTSSESDGSFVWSWANADIPAQHGQALEVVHDFGRKHQLALLTPRASPVVGPRRPNVCALPPACSVRWVPLSTSKAISRCTSASCICKWHGRRTKPCSKR